MNAGYVYIVHGTGTVYIKIGKTTNLFTRLQHLSQGVPFPLVLLAADFVADMDMTEKTLHTKYAAYRTRGEWFALPEAMLARWPITGGTATGGLVKAHEQHAAIEQQVYQLLSTQGQHTVRDLNRRLSKKLRSRDIQASLGNLLAQGVITERRQGRRRLYSIVSRQTEVS